jgi:LPS-assembly protein
VRFVAQRIATAVQDTSNAFFIQLELSGLARLGADPLGVLRQSIPGYSPVFSSQRQAEGAP